MKVPAALVRRDAPHGMVCTVDHLASEAGVALLRAGGSAADAAVGASAVLAVTTQHMCGLGGDLFALVHHRDGAPPDCLNASGRAGSGADPDRLRAAGHRVMPFRGSVASVPVPGCVDGWSALHARHGRLPIGDVLAPALALAEGGFPASPQLAAAVRNVADVEGNDDYARGPVATGTVIRRPGVARSLRAIAEGGRDAWYRGEFGAGLVRVGAGEYHEDDLARSQADWVLPAQLDVWDHRAYTVPPNSQGYLSLAGGWIAERAGLPADAEDGLWAHLLVEAARAAGHDRPDVLHEHADAAALLDPARLEARLAAVRPDRAASWEDDYSPGGTIYLCAVDAERMGVSLIQSNASGFGAHLTVPELGVFLHNRGIGFSLEPGHPAEYGPGRRPPHTLSPALLQRADGSLRAVLGTMGGDGQPQVILQMLARLLQQGQDAGTVVAGPRWTLERDHGTGFDTWLATTDAGGMGRQGGAADGLTVVLEADAPAPWVDGLRDRGHRVDVRDRWNWGHAQMIEVTEAATLSGAADPRALTGAAAGY